MSGSEGVVMASREPFGVNLQKSPPIQPHQAMQNMRLCFNSDGTTVYKPVAGSSPTYQLSSTNTGAGAIGGGGGTIGGGGGGDHTVVPQGLNMNMSEPAKRKRGRPRKYGPDGSMALALVSTQPQSPGSFSPYPASSGPASPSLKKARGRPPGSSKKQQMEALGSAGVGFTPHVITVRAGEDVSSKIMSFSQNGPRDICILSANGAISNVTLRQPAISGGTVTYEGRFEVLSLSGSFMLTESGGQRSRTGGLSVSLSGPDGRVLGGGVAGLLTAASPVQVVVGSFIADGRKEQQKPANQMEPLSGPPKMAPSVGPTGPSSSPPSRGTLSESSGGPGSPLNHSTGACNNTNPYPMSTMPWK